MTVVLCAAGCSRRMQGRNKLLLKKQEKTLLQHMLDLYAEICGPLVLVTGHNSKEIAAQAAGTDCKVIYCPDYKLGQQASVVYGLRYALSLPESQHSPILVALADQPKLQKRDVLDLLKFYNTTGGTKITVPFYKDTNQAEKRGNPVVFPSVLLEKAIAAPQFKPRQYIDANPRDVQKYWVQHDHFCADIDTPEDAIRYGFI